MATPIIIENLTKRFGTKTVLERVNLHIAAGELFFLLGPSGCGKTTLLRAVAGLNEPDEGRDTTETGVPIRADGAHFSAESATWFWDTWLAGQVGAAFAPAS